MGLGVCNFPITIYTSLLSDDWLGLGVWIIALPVFSLYRLYSFFSLSFSKYDSDLGCVGMICRVYEELESGKVAGRIVLDVTK